MVTATNCLEKYGEATSNNRNLVLWAVPENLAKGHIPRRVYANIDLIKPLTRAFENIISRDLVDELETWDGCFNIRSQRGGVVLSLHSWAIAVDVNARGNQLGKPPRLTPAFVACFTDAGFDWGGNWHRPDGMHFQLSAI